MADLEAGRAASVWAQKDAKCSRKMGLFQANLNHCSFAQDLFSQTPHESPNPNNKVRVADPKRGAILWAYGDQTKQECIRQPTNGFVWAKIYG